MAARSNLSFSISPEPSLKIMARWSARSRAALGKNGIPFTADELKRWKGASKREVIRHFVMQLGTDSGSAEKVETTYNCFRSELLSLYAARYQAHPGRFSAFSWCREHDIRMATTTGFYREVSELILEKMGWREVFAANISSSDVRLGRPAPFMIFHAMEAAGVHDVRQVINVGDTPLDLQSGSNAGATLAGCAAEVTVSPTRDWRTSFTPVIR